MVGFSTQTVLTAIAYIIISSRAIVKGRVGLNHAFNLGMDILDLCKFAFGFLLTMYQVIQALSQDLETGCPKLPIVKILGILIFKGGHNILRLEPQI